MSDIEELVIKIPKEIRLALINNIQLDVNQQFICNSYIKQAIKKGIPLPKRHKRLIEDEGMTYGEIYNKALCKLCLECKEVEDYRPACRIHIPELERDIPNAIIIWLKDGSKVIYIEPEESEKI